MMKFKASIISAALILAPGIAMAQTTEAGQPESPAVSRHMRMERAAPRVRDYNREPGVTSGAASSYDPAMAPRYYPRALPPGVAADGETEAGSMAGSGH